MKSSRNIIRRFLQSSLTKQLFSYQAASSRRQILTSWVAVAAAIFFSAALFCPPALADTNSAYCAGLLAERAPLPALCSYSFEHAFVYRSRLPDDDQNAIDTALNTFLAGKGTIADVDVAITSYRRGRESIEVVLVYICTDNSGGIQRLQFKLTSEDEKSHWTASAVAGRTGSATENTRMQDVITARHRPTGSCCTATATTPAATVTPTPKPAKTGGARSENRSPGMGSMDSSTLQSTVTLEIKTGNSSVNIILPDDIRPGDTISGTVVNVVPGQVVDVKTVEGEVVEVGGKNIPVSNGKMIFTIPMGASSIPLILKSASGKHIGDAVISVNTSANFSGNIPTQLGSFAPPRLGQTGRDITIPGNFDGNAANTTVNVGGRQLPVIAESPRKTVVQIPADTPTGANNITINENPGISQTVPFNVVSLELKADKLNLRSGEKTSLHVSITGLEGLKDNSGSIKLQVENASPQTVNLTFSPAFQRTGSVGTLLTRAVDLDGAGTIAFTEQLTGVHPGNFTINATLFDLMQRR